MKNIAILVCLMLSGCANFGMTPEQLKASAGMSTCSSINSLVYGKASMITANADDIKKGQTGNGKVNITCGDATMTVESAIGVSNPAQTTTTTTTIAK